MKKWWPRPVKITLLLLGIFILSLVVFLSCHPAIGAFPKGDDLARISRSPHYQNGRFQNLIETEEGSLSAVWKNRKAFLNAQNTSPKDSLPVKFGPFGELPDSLCRVTWYGHSAFLFEIAGMRVLIDPMLSDYPSPIAFGSKRFPYQRSIPLEDLRAIDLMIISHDHYDHLDYPSILALKDQVKEFITPLGVGSHLKHWGIAPERIKELDWWQERQIDELKIIATPARHFSGRSLWNRNSSQWASWVLISPDQRIFFSGDGGYGPHFKEIGTKHGPFDVALMECGQYNKAWSQIHCMPEESVLAGQDLQAELLMPIHWGAFSLAVHEWTEPISRFKAEAQKLKMPLIHPFIGESFVLKQDYPREEWWRAEGL